MVLDCFLFKEMKQKQAQFKKSRYAGILNFNGKEFAELKQSGHI
jgi:hypothetical protein